jgi:hypothetical protein
MIVVRAFIFDDRRDRIKRSDIVVTKMVKLCLQMPEDDAFHRDRRCGYGRSTAKTRKNTENKSAHATQTVTTATAHPTGG